MVKPGFHLKKKTLVFTKTSCAESWESKHLRAQLVMHMHLLIGIHAWKLTGQPGRGHTKLGGMADEVSTTHLEI